MGRKRKRAKGREPRAGRSRAAPDAGGSRAAAPIRRDPGRVGGARIECAICEAVDGVRPFHMTRRVVVHLCRTHRTDAYLSRDDGREFTDRIEAAWRTLGLATSARLAALAAHRRAHGPRPDRSHCPGSYSWPALRLEAEGRFASGEPPREVIGDLRSRHVEAPATVPSVQTMRRWFRERRWLDRGAADGDGGERTQECDPPADVRKTYYTRTGKPPHPLLRYAGAMTGITMWRPFDAHIYDMSRGGPAEDDFGDRWIHGP